MIHLVNCHGEWTFIALVLTQLPLIGLIFAEMLSRLSKKGSGNEGERP